MSLDYATLEILRRQHPAWRLLLAEHAALIASFLHKAFVSPNVRMKSAADLERVGFSWVETRLRFLGRRGRSRSGVEHNDSTKWGTRGAQLHRWDTKVTANQLLLKPKLQLQ
jgi:Protein of unknown function (DUF3375)